MIPEGRISLSLRFAQILFLFFFALLLGTGESTKHNEPHFRYRVKEEMPKGTVVCNLVEDSGLGQSPADVLQVLRFRFLTEPTDHLFDIDASSGVVTTAVVIDRDAATLCRQKELCEVSVDVVIQPSQHFRILKVVVEIVDVNDNAPRFRESRIALQVNEAAAVGSAYIVPTAGDVDSPANGVQRYELDSVSSRFGLQINPKLDGTLEVKLVLKAKLDRELESEYHLKLMAFDTGSPETARTGSLAIDVLVQDSNDNRPEFTRHQYEASVVENAPIGSPVLQVTAIDKDAGPNGAVGYSFATQTQSVHGHLFAIDNRTGGISVRGLIDHEKASVHQLVVIAQDHGPDMLSSEVTVIVHVDDVNDNPPSVRFHTLTSADDPIAEILEDSAVGTFVAHISVHDPDTGRNGQVNCSINEKVFSLVQKYPSDYQIATAAMLDRERTDRYEVILRCHDGAPVTPLVTEKMLRVIVTDVNDNPPVFDRTQYVGSLRENNHEGASVLQVTATDLDEGNNARIQYSLPANVSAFFSIDDRGVISARRSLDRETHASFNFAVFAADLGSPSASGSALVTIGVEDVNDERPQFTHRAFAFSVHENEPSGQTVGVLAALDLDGPPFDGFLFSLPTADDNALFSVDPVTGIVRTQRPLDREQTAVYRFAVTVYDPHASVKMDTASVGVSVLDRNDNSPEFVFPNAFNNSVYVSSHLPPGRTVAQVQAGDRDVDNNARLTFKVLDNRNNNGTFAMEGNAVVVVRRLPLVDNHLYQVTLQAVDGGDPPRTATTVLNVHVNQSIPFTDTVSGAEDKEGSVLSAYAVVIVIGVASGCSVVAFLLVVAIVLVRQKDKRRHIRKYNCRMEALRMLTTKQAQVSSSSPESSPRKKKKKAKKALNGSKPIAYKGGDDAADGGAAGAVPKITADVISTHSVIDGGLPVISKPWHSNKDLEVQPWIHSSKSIVTCSSSSAAAPVEGDRDSVHSVEGSVTDSGRGPSEEGEAGHIRHNRERFLPPPPPPPRGAFWLQQQQQQQQQQKVSSGAGTSSAAAIHPTIRFQGLSSTPEEYVDPADSSPSTAAGDGYGGGDRSSFHQRRLHVQLPPLLSSSTPPGILVSRMTSQQQQPQQNRTGNRLLPGQQQQQQTTLDQLSRQRTTLDQLSRLESVDQQMSRLQLAFDRSLSRSRDSVCNQSTLDRSATTATSAKDVIV